MIQVLRIKMLIFKKYILDIFLSSSERKFIILLNVSPHKGIIIETTRDGDGYFIMQSMQSIYLKSNHLW
ncbi:hypothetical protein RclHR1_01380007 [Rhizophagus clarus]|uniref:Uncharacterized protein n=1 Tax=Rhizophagus clarus TaxID=94130 RepID=A0A2Z6QCV5_9GLOM|nr:hypothetical protein RclHR1_01380007 [Rhizophagus clarus]